MEIGGTEARKSKIGSASRNMQKEIADDGTPHSKLVHIGLAYDESTFLPQLLNDSRFERAFIICLVGNLSINLD
jgi:hypothetical protein